LESGSRTQEAGLRGDFALSSGSSRVSRVERKLSTILDAGARSFSYTPSERIPRAALGVTESVRPTCSKSDVVTYISRLSA
jgi:hypothetical protein